MPSFNAVRNSLKQMAGELLPRNTFRTQFKPAPSLLRTIGEKSIDLAKDIGSAGKDFAYNAIGGATANFRPTNIRDAWTKGIPAYIDELKNTTFNPKAWKESPLGTLGSTAANTVFPALSLNMALSDDPNRDTEGTIENFARRAMEWTDVVDPANKFIFRGGGRGLGSIAGSMFLNPRFNGLMSKALKKVDNFFGTGVSQAELQKRFMSRLDRDAANLMKKHKGLSQNEAYEQAAQSILSYNPDYYKRLIGSD